MLENTNALIACMLAVVHEKQQVATEMEEAEDKAELDDLGYYFVDLETALGSLAAEYGERAAKDPALPDISQILAGGEEEDDEDEDEEEDEAGEISH